MTVWSTSDFLDYYLPIWSLVTTEDVWKGNEQFSTALKRRQSLRAEYGQPATWCAHLTMERSFPEKAISSNQQTCLRCFGKTTHPSIHSSYRKVETLYWSYSNAKVHAYLTSIDNMNTWNAIACDHSTERFGANASVLENFWRTEALVDYAIKMKIIRPCYHPQLEILQGSTQKDCEIERGRELSHNS